MLPNSYKTVQHEAMIVFEERKSKFIGRIIGVSKEEEAIRYIQEIREAHRDATHTVYAYIVTGEETYQRFSDDGEPQGTAGLPVLEAMKRAEIINAVCVVTRYFGGIQLGAPGLVRAYGKSAALSIEEAQIVEKNKVMVYEATVEYPFVGAIKKMLPEHDFVVGEARYEIDVVFTVACKIGKEEDLLQLLDNITSGAVLMEKIGVSWI